MSVITPPKTTEPQHLTLGADVLLRTVLEAFQDFCATLSQRRIDPWCEATRKIAARLRSTSAAVVAHEHTLMRIAV